MKKECKPIPFLIMNIVLVLNMLIFWSIRSMWSGIIAIAGKPVPYILMAVLTLTTLLATGFSLNKKYCPITFIWGCILDVLFLGLNGYMLSVTLDSFKLFIREFGYGLLYIGGISLLVFLCFYSSKIGWIQKKWIPPVFLSILLIGGVFVFFDIQLINDIDKTPVVYAVEDTYQITFTTQAKGEAWVVIDGVEYNDTYAGYRKTETDIHKITVPMEVLDNADSYTVYTRAMLLRGPYEALQGNTISKTYTWRGIDDRDGLQYYTISDNHLASKAPAAAANYWGNQLDFLISLGDTANWIDNKEELTQILYLASDITQGEIPVLYARGNHEAKGILADQYHNYVAAKGENYYYTFRLNNIWGIVLDAGEDHEDSYKEFSGLAYFDQYRATQTEFLDEVLANADNEFNAEGVEYRIALCHIPLTLTTINDPLAEQKNAWITRLNQMNLDLMYSGHLHELIYVDTNISAETNLTHIPAYSGKENNTKAYILSESNFPTILVSKRGTSQLLTDEENYFDKVFIGVASSFDGKETTIKFTNEKHEIIKTISPWFEGITYGEEIRIKK